MIFRMNDDLVKNKKLWVPERVYGVCIWITPDGVPLSDGDGVLSAEGFVGDKNIERQVAEAAKYWTGTSDGCVRWVHGARKVSDSEREMQAERLANGLVADPYEDAIEYLARRR
jgi:hypothetical protein